MTRQEHDDFDESKIFSPPPESSNAGWDIPQKTLMPAAPMENPLRQFYRLPGLHVTLPTRGAFLPPGTFQPTMTNDVPVLPMRAADEMLLKSPDALMSGYAIEQLVKSCVPSIKVPRYVSTPDLDVILLAIRAATHGNKMTVHANCPKCNQSNELECDLSGILATIKYIEPVNMVRLTDEIIVYVRPYNMMNATKAAYITFEETRKMQSFEEDNDLRRQQMNKSLGRLAALNIELLADCIMKIVIPGAEVTDRKEISDFIDNVSKVWVSKIEDKLKEINSKGIDKKLNVVCNAIDEETKEVCGHEWTTEVEFDPSNFFEGTSSV